MSNVFEIALYTMIEANDSRVIRFWFIITDDAFRVEVADYKFEIHMAVRYCWKDTSDYVNYFMLFEIDLLHDVVA